MEKGKDCEILSERMRRGRSGRSGRSQSQSRSQSRERGRDERDRKPTSRHLPRERDQSRDRSPRRSRSRSRDRYRERDRGHDDRNRHDRYRPSQSYQGSRRNGMQRSSESPRPSSHDNGSADNGSILTAVPIHPLLATAGGGDPLLPATSKRLPVAAIASVRANVRAGESSILQDSMARRRVSERSAVDQFLSIRPARTTSTKNPHFDPSLPSANRGSRSASIKFVRPGSLVAEAEERRARETLEALRREVAESLANVGIDTDIVSDLMTAEDVPGVEWWDRPFQGTEVWNRLYPMDSKEGAGHASIVPLDNIITNLIQRPALLPAPLDELRVQPRPLFLTMEERKKLRRQRRLAEHREQQESIKLGLLPPPPPKTRIANIARVLGVQAAAEPTRLEAELRAAAAERHTRHLQANRERQEAATKQAARRAPFTAEANDQGGGRNHSLLSILVVRIEGTIHQIPQWRFKVTKNAQQYGLTGCMISLAGGPPPSTAHGSQSAIEHLAVGSGEDRPDDAVSDGTLRNPPFTLIVAEGGATAIRRYRHLLLERIKWDQPPAPATDRQGVASPSNSSSDPLALTASASGAGAEAPGQPNVVIPSSTRCSLVWEGQQTEAHYRGFISQVLPTELDILEYLAIHQSEHFWRAAKKAYPTP